MMLISEERSLWSTLYGLSSCYSQGRNKVNKIKGWIGIGFLLIYIPRYQCLLCQYYEACLFLFYFQIWLPLSSHVIQTRDVDNRYWTWKSEKLWDFSVVPCEGIEKSGGEKVLKRGWVAEKELLTFEHWFMVLFVPPHTPVPDKSCMQWCKKAESMDSVECFTENKFMHRRHL